MATFIRVLPEVHTALAALVELYPFINVNKFVAFVLSSDTTEINGIMDDKCTPTSTPVNLKRAITIIAACKTFDDATGNWAAYEPDGREEERVKEALLNIYTPLHSNEYGMRKSSYIDPTTL